MNEIVLVLCLTPILLICLLRRVPRDVGEHIRCLACAVEPLEARIAPAVTAHFSAGVLFVTGDSEVNTLNVLKVGDSIDVLDGGTSLGTFSNVKSIKMNTEGGGFVNVNVSDGGIPGSLTAVTSGVTIFTLVTNSSIGGSFSLKGDTAAQTLIVNGGVSIGKSLTYNGAGGADSFVLSEAVNIGGNATFVAIEDGDFNTTSGAITIDGALRIQNTTTPLPVQFEVAGANGLLVSGKTSYLGGSAGDGFFLAGNFSSAVSFLDRLGSNSFALGLNSTVSGNVTVGTGDGNDTFGIQGGTIEGSLSLKLGNGSNAFIYGIGGSVTIGGNLLLIGGSGEDRWQTSGGNITVSGRLTINLGDGTNTILAGVTVNGPKVTILTGNGVDLISISGTATAATVIISLGDGNDSLLGNLAAASASALLHGGGGIDHLFENIFQTDPLIIMGFEDFSDP